MKPLTLSFATTFLMIVSGTAAPAMRADSAAGHVLWDAWYTVTVKSGKTVLHYGYYNDHVERKKNQIWFKTDYCKHEEDFFNQEHLMSIVSDDDNLSGVLFDFRANYRGQEMSSHGDFESPTLMSIKVGLPGHPPRSLKRSTPKSAFLSALFPYWISKRLAQFKIGQTHSYSCVLEDGSDPDFDSKSGQLRLEKPDAFALKTKTSKLSVEFRDVPSIWYVDTHGVAERIELPGMNTVIEKTTQAAALKFIPQCN